MSKLFFAIVFLVGLRCLPNQAGDCSLERLKIVCDDAKNNGLASFLCDEINRCSKSASSTALKNKWNKAHSRMCTYGFVPEGLDDHCNM